jgi:hypothetical protein
MRLGVFKAVTTWVSAMLLLAVVGCGGGASREARQLGSLSILESTRPLAKNLVTPNEIEPASDASGAKTLLEFWLTLQRGEYESATSYFDPAYTKSAGASNLVVLLRKLAPLWDSTKPRIAVAKTTGRSARVYFNVRDLLGHVGSVEIAYRKLGRHWKITFLSLLAIAPPA